MSTIEIVATAVALVGALGCIAVLRTQSQLIDMRVHRERCRAEYAEVMRRCEERIKREKAAAEVRRILARVTPAV